MLADTARVTNVRIIIIITRWYQGFDWEGLKTQSSTPPIVPKVHLYTGILRTLVE